jgi:hypothetical protein
MPIMYTYSNFTRDPVKVSLLEEAKLPMFLERPELMEFLGSLDK